MPMIYDDMKRREREAEEVHWAEIARKRKEAKEQLIYGILGAGIVIMMYVIVKISITVIAPNFEFGHNLDKGFIWVVAGTTLISVVVILRAIITILKLRKY